MMVDLWTDVSSLLFQIWHTFILVGRPIKIEIISDVVAATPPAPAAAQAPSLFQRMGGIAPAKKPLAAPPQQYVV